MIWLPILDVYDSEEKRLQMSKIATWELPFVDRVALRDKYGVKYMWISANTAQNLNSGILMRNLILPNPLNIVAGETCNVMLTAFMRATIGFLFGEKNVDVLLQAMRPLLIAKIP